MRRRRSTRTGGRRRRARDDERDAALDEHARAVRRHVDALAAATTRRSSSARPTFVVLFLPDEGFLAAAAARDRALIEHALGKGVVLATPATLYALLGAVARGWRDARLEAHTREVLVHARELDERLALFVEHLGKVGAGLSAARSRRSTRRSARSSRACCRRRGACASSAPRARVRSRRPSRSRSRCVDGGIGGDAVPMAGPTTVRVERRPAIGTPLRLDDLDGAEPLELRNDRLGRPDQHDRRALGVQVCVRDRAMSAGVTARTRVR